MFVIKTTYTIFISFIAFILSSAPAFSAYIDDPPPGLSLYMDIPTAYMLTEGQFEATVSYRTVNDTVDVFGFKEDIAGGSNIGTRGDYHGTQGVFHFGLWEGLQVSYKGELRNLDAGLSTGDVEYASHDVMLKQNLFREESWYPTVALGVFYRGNRAENISRTFNSVSGSFLGVSVPSTPLEDPATITFGGIEDDSFGAALFTSKSFTPQLSIHTSLEYSRTIVGSELHLETGGLDVNILNDFSRLLETSDYMSHNFSFGFGAVYQVTKDIMFSADYKRIQVRRSGQSEIAEKDFNSNNVISWQVSYSPVSWFAMSATGTYFSNQFLGVIPSLYNSRTASKFGKDYGYLGVGITFFHDFGASIFKDERF